MGYDIVRTVDVEWSLFALGASRYTRYRSVDPGEDDTERLAVIPVGTLVEIEITNDIDFEAQYRVDIGVNDIRDTNQTADATLSVELTDIVDLDLSFIWTRIGDPQTGADGIEPDKDDLQLLVGLGVNF